MTEITVGARWPNVHPQASVGVLIMRAVQNPTSHPDLDTQKNEIEKTIRKKYAGLERSDLRSLPTLAAYDQFYRRFKKTYHLQLQLESVIAGKSIPSVAALVEAMFMAELENLLLTAGHDLDRVETPIVVDVATGSETYVRMNGEQQTLKPDDLYIRDAEGILSSVIYGPDRRTRIQPETRNVLFTTYAVPGVATTDLTSHLETLRDYVLLISENAEVDTLQIIGQ